jgi:hypothetical protein
MIPSNKKNYYDLTLCVMDKDDPTKVEIYYPVIAADSVLLKPGGRQTILHHIEDKTQQLHLTDEMKRLLRSDPEHGGLVRLDSNGHIPIDYIEPRLVAMYFEFDTVEDMLNNNEFGEGDFGRLVLVKDCTGDPRIHTSFPIEWVIYRLIDEEHPSSIDSYTPVLQKHDMDRFATWDDLDHGIQATVQQIDQMVRESHSHPDAVNYIQDENGHITYKGKKITFRDAIHAVIVTENRAELNNMNPGDIALLVTKVQELIVFDDVEHEVPFVELSGNQDELYKGTMGLVEGPKLRTKEVTSCKGFFEDCADLENYMWYDTSHCVDMSYMNHGCSKLKYIPSLSMASATNINNFAEASGIIRYFDLFSESVEYANYVFKNCLKMECIDALYLPNAITSTEFFSGDASLRSLPRVINVSSSKNVDGFFEDCLALEQVYSVKAESAVSMKRMFKGCGNLASIASINMNSCKDTTEMFTGCSKLQYIGIAQGTLHTNISFSGTKISITCLRNIIKGIDGTGLGHSINVQGTPAGRELTADDEATIRAKGWNLIY